MSKLDETIAGVAYVLDSLMSLRMIYDSGDCNDCGRNDCEWKPDPGHMVRYNCPHYERGRVARKADDQQSPRDGTPRERMIRKTNREKLADMTNEELGRFLCHELQVACRTCIAKKFCTGGTNGIARWLDAEEEGTVNE